jgi:hypothetical protein
VYAIPVTEERLLSKIELKGDAIGGDFDDLVVHGGLIA